MTAERIYLRSTGSKKKKNKKGRSLEEIIIGRKRGLKRENKEEMEKELLTKKMNLGKEWWR